MKQFTDVRFDGNALETGALVSLIVVAAPNLRGTKTSILDSVKFISNRYAFYEILLITNDTDNYADEVLEVLGREVPQLRLLQIEGGGDFDDLAIHGYQEAIGDTIILSSSDELPYIDLEMLLAPIRTGAQFVRLRRKSGSVFAKAVASVMRFLTGFEVDIRYYRTLALGRQILSDLLKIPSQLHLIRFTAVRHIRKQKTVTVELPPVRRSGKHAIARLELVLHLIAVSSVRLLRLATALCSLLSLGALVAMMYPFLLWIIGWNVMEGWSSTITMISAWACIQLAAAAVMCLGISRALELQQARTAPRVVGDRSIGDLFRSSNLLNVEDATLTADADGQSV
ncbi:glucosyl transferase [Ochrobactrum sp. BD67]